MLFIYTVALRVKTLRTISENVTLQTKQHFRKHTTLCFDPQGHCMFLPSDIKQLGVQ